MKQNLKEIYEQILNDEEIKNTYKQVEEYETAHGGWAYHNLEHVKNVTKIVKQILIDLNFSKEFIYKAMIACLLHDIGATGGKENHAHKSYEYAKKYFDKNDIDFEDLNLVLEAIKIHSEGFETDNIIALSLIFADKLDIKKSRITEAGKKVIGNREYAHIDDIKVNIKEQKLRIEFITDKNINIKEASEFYFTKKVFQAVQAFARKMKLEYEILIDGTVWNLDFFK